MTVRKRLHERIVYLRYLAIWQIAAFLPGSLAKHLPPVLGWLWCRFGASTQRAQVTRNLARITPDLNDVEMQRHVKQAYVAYVRYWLDSFRLHRTNPQDLIDRVNDHGVQRILDVTADGQGAVFITGHLGSWELGAAFCSANNLRLLAVAEEVRPKQLFDRFVKLRADAGITVMALRRGADLIGPLANAMSKDGALATLLADRDLTRSGPIVSFFGEPCRLPAGPAALALRTNRPILAAAFYVTGDRYDGVVRPVITPINNDVYDVTQQVAHEIEALIRIAPEQWHVFVPNWLCEREPNHPVVAAWKAGHDWRALAKEDYASRRRRKR
ncbi:MAG: phosphatidylinositol mannoside acyltransferase [Nitriliruptoraceae bacterium]